MVLNTRNICEVEVHTTFPILVYPPYITMILIKSMANEHIGVLNEFRVLLNRKKFYVAKHETIFRKHGTHERPHWPRVSTYTIVDYGVYVHQFRISYFSSAHLKKLSGYQRYVSINLSYVRVHANFTDGLV